MHALAAIKSACLAALDEDDEDAAGNLAEFRSVADPHTVLDLVELIERYQEKISEEELQALGQLVRELTGYIKKNGGIEPNRERDDLLLRARQLLGVTGL